MIRFFEGCRLYDGRRNRNHNRLCRFKRHYSRVDIRVSGCFLRRSCCCCCSVCESKVAQAGCERQRSTFKRRSEWINTSQNKGELCFSRDPRTRQAHCSTACHSCVSQASHMHLFRARASGYGAGIKTDVRTGRINCGNLGRKQQTHR